MSKALCVYETERQTDRVWLLWFTPRVDPSPDSLDSLRQIQSRFSNQGSPPPGSIQNGLTCLFCWLLAPGWPSGLKTSVILYFSDALTFPSGTPSTQFPYHFRCLLFNLRHRYISWFFKSTLSGLSKVNA